MMKIKCIFVVIGAVTALLIGNSYAADRPIKSRHKRSPLDVRNCDISPPYTPPTVFDSAVRLTELRRQMREFIFQYEAYIIPGYDAHGSEYLADPDRRIYFMSGFNGTGGFAIVTLDKAAIWTEPRFELLAQQQLDCNWEIMILDDIDFLTPWQWVIRDDRTNDQDDEDFIPGAGLDAGEDVGFDPLLMPFRDWYELSEANKIETRSMDLVTHEEEYNLVDLTWKELEKTKDPYPGEKLMVQNEDIYTGYTWREKIYQPLQSNTENFKNLRDIMADRDSDLLVLTGLDEIAWLFNIRGEDIPYNPLFISYAIIGANYIYLYLYDSNERLNIERYPEVVQHLELETCQLTSCISARSLSAFYDDLTTTNRLVFSQKVWFSNTSNYFVYDAIMDLVGRDEQKYIFEPSPVLLMKAVKNSDELEQMKEAMLIDAVTMIEMVTWMQGLLEDMPDPKVGDPDILTEYMVSERTETLRDYQNSYMYPSYETIAAIGLNGADYYYHPTENDRIPITTGQMFLYDMGAQYREGTTTLTRTFYFSKEDDFPYGYTIAEPTDFQKEIYTRVLLGHIDLANASFRSNIYGRDLDMVARQHLWNYGLDYFHPTGYGVGQFLTVHEDPVNIGDYTLDETFHQNMIISNGPGYYYTDPDGDYDNNFGVRITNVMRVVNAETQFAQEGVDYMEFEMMSFAPFEPRLINFHLFTRKQLEWYNNYNEQIRDELEGKLSPNAREWMLSRTRFQKYDFDYIGGASTVSIATAAMLMPLGLCMVFMRAFIQ